jgi:superoxide dismutase, Fe-Mn family
MKHVLTALPYPLDALEPHIDARTMQVHHDGHHAAYVNNLNKALEGLSEQADWSAEDLLARLEKVPEAVRTAVRNNAGGHVNHSMFWTIMAPKPQRAPRGDLSAAVNGAFGSFDGFKEAFSKAALGVFGSGWAWLVLDKSGRLAVKGMPNQDSPILNGEKPVMGLDVWEHAYYLAYQNRRADYIQAWWNVVNWEAVEERWRMFSAPGEGTSRK